MDITVEHPRAVVSACPVCDARGKPVPGQTIKALLAVTLRHVGSGDYLFCRTPTCPVVYFSSDGDQTFTAGQVRERVYQKEPEADDVLICYCFQHRLGDVRNGTAEAQKAIVDNINAGIQVGQCACDLRNPQGSCCLGNVQALLKRLEDATTNQS